jgi:uncharacterized protein involved in exopolysaccharide biosynthesis
MNEEMDLRGFLRQCALTIFLCSLLSAITVVAVALNLPPKYESFSTVFVTASDPLTGLFQSAIEGIGLTSGTDDRKGYAMSVLQSEDLKSEVLVKLEPALLEKFWGEEPKSSRTREAAWEKMADMVRIEQERSDAAPIQIRATTGDAELSFALTRHYVELFMAKVASDNSTQEDFLGKQLVQARKDLAAATARLQAFQEKEDLPFNLDAQGEADFAALTLIYTEHAKALVEFSAADKQLQGPGDAQTQLAIASTKAGAEAKVKVLGKMLEEQTLKLERMPRLINLFRSLQRDIGEKSKIVESLAQQHELSKFQVAKTVSPFRIIDQPFLPGRPAKRPLVALAITGLALGAVAGLGLSLLREALRAPKPPEKDASQE